MKSIFQRHGATSTSSRIRSFTPGLNQTMFGLELLASVAEGAGIVPGLKSVAQVAIQIVETAQKVKSNKEDCMILSQRTVQLMVPLIDVLKDKKEGDIDQGLERDLTAFRMDLEKILEVMISLASQTSFRRILKHADDSDEIIRCKEMMDHSFKTFQVYSQVALRVQMNEVREDMGNIKLTFSDTSPAPIPEVLHLSKTPPAAPSIFFGRDEIVAKSVKLIQETTTPAARLVILGTGGMGKTSLALTILHHSQIRSKFQDACYFVPCDAAVTPALFVASILQVLGASSRVGSDALTVLHHHLMASPPMLLVLDNFETPWDEPGYQAEMETILQRIAAVSHVTLLITMRGSASPSGVQWTDPEGMLPLPALSLEAARLAFLAVNPSKSDDSDLDMLLKELDCVPLAVMLMSQLAKGKSCQYLLRRWKKEQTSMLKTQMGTAGRLTSLDVSISISVKHLQDDPEAVQMLSLIAYLPDGLLKWEESLELMAPEFKCPEQAMELLLRAALVYVDNTGTMKVLSPIRHYVQSNYSLESQHLRSLENHYIDLVSQYGSVQYGPNYAEAFKCLMPELGNISSIIHHALQHHSYPKIVFAVYRISTFLYYAQPSVDLLFAVLPCLQGLCMEYLEASCHWMIGTIYSTMGRSVDAQREFETSLEKYKGQGPGQGPTDALHGLGRILYIQGKYSEAKEKLKQAQEEYIQLGDEIHATTCLQNLGEIHYAQGNYTEATEAFELSHTQFVDLGFDLGASQCIQSLGRILLVKEDFVEATKLLEKALHQSEKLSDNLGQAQCFEGIAQIHLKQHKVQECSEYLNKALKIYKEKNNQKGVAHCLQQLGILPILLSRSQESYSGGMQLLKDAHDLYMELKDIKGAGQCLQSIAELLVHMEDIPESKKTMKKAIDVFKDIDYETGVNECIISLANITFMEPYHKDQLSTGSKEYEIANKDAWNLFITVEAKLNTMDELAAAFCLQSMGSILYQQKQYSAAMAKFEQALIKFQRTGNNREIGECLRLMAYNLYCQKDEKAAIEKWKEANNLVPKALKADWRWRQYITPEELQEQQRIISLHRLYYNAPRHSSLAVSYFPTPDERWPKP